MAEDPFLLDWLERPSATLRAEVKALSSTGGATALAGLAALARTDLDLDQLTLVSRCLARLGTGDHDQAARLRLLVLGNHTTGYLSDALPAAALRHGLGVNVVQAPYDQIAQEAFNPDSTSRRSAADVVLLAIDHRQLGLTGSLADTAAADALADGVVALLGSVAETLGAALGATILVSTLPQTTAVLAGDIDAAHEGSLYAQIARVNAGLRHLARRPGCVLVDVERLAARIGLMRWHDDRLWFAGKVPYALAAVPALADQIARRLAAVRGRSRKCLVLDLDNTMWGGVIGDDGMAGIQIANGSATGEAYRAIQSYALEQRARGVMLAICSKNEHDVAVAVFRDHPDMLVREDHVAAFQVNWDDKATNLRRIAQTLNIGLDSLVFVDDNPAERLRVRQMLAEVAVPELGNDPADYVGVLTSASYFEAISLSSDDMMRAAAYQANAARIAEMTSLGDMDRYLESLDMLATIAPFDAIGRARIAQLVNKSNQFNLTTRRYAEADIAAMEDDPALFTMQVRLVDRFGDNGMICVVIFRRDGNVWRCDTWLMSCRVLKRRVEELVLREVAAAARAAGATALVGDYRPTAKNMIVAGHFATLGFAPLGEEPDGSTHWRLDLAEYAAPDLPIRVQSA